MKIRNYGPFVHPFQKKNCSFCCHPLLSHNYQHFGRNLYQNWISNNDVRYFELPNIQHIHQRENTLSVSPLTLVWKRVWFLFLTWISTLTCAQDYLLKISETTINSYKGHPAHKPLYLQTDDNNRPKNIMRTWNAWMFRPLFSFKNRIVYHPSMTYDLCDMVRTIWAWSFPNMWSLHFSRVG